MMGTCCKYKGCIMGVYIYLHIRPWLWDFSDLTVHVVSRSKVGRGGWRWDTNKSRSTHTPASTIHGRLGWRLTHAVLRTRMLRGPTRVGGQMCTRSRRRSNEEAWELIGFGYSEIFPTFGFGEVKFIFKLVPKKTPIDSTYIYNFFLFFFPPPLIFFLFDQCSSAAIK